jgi:outer membrane receptor protein involved in Fe transport
MEGAAIAINDQRFAPNTKNVASTDEYGNVAEGNPAEFLKFLPGITIDYTGGNARDISINGTPSTNVPVMVDGFSVASAANRATGRNVQSDMISINGLARIEVSYSPTPESPGSALAGSVNMVPRSAFERSRPILNWSGYLLWRDNARDFRAGARTEAQPHPQRPSRVRLQLRGADQPHLRLHALRRHLDQLLPSGPNHQYLARRAGGNDRRRFPSHHPGSTLSLHPLRSRMRQRSRRASRWALVGFQTFAG